MHLRAPSFDRGTTAGIWAVGLGLYVLLGMLAIGMAVGTSFIVAILAVGLIFLYIRLYGEQNVPR